jgi:hydrogenase maturation protease
MTMTKRTIRAVPHRAAAGRSTLVLGIGNLLMRDEGVGPHAVRALAAGRLPEGVECMDGGTLGADLLDAIADRRKLIVIDAVSADARPGSVFKYALDDFEPGAGAVSLHECGVLETLGMAGMLGCAPEEVVIFGVQPGDVRLGLSLSPDVAGAIPRLLEAVLAEAARDRVSPPRRPRPATAS